MLDVAVWLEVDQGNCPKVRHTYYEKPSTSPLVFHGRGACAMRQKIIILAEEVKRRLLNMDPAHTQEQRLEVLLKFSQKVSDSGYLKEVRKEILYSGITRYYRMVLLELAGGRKLYRSAQEMKESREMKPLKSKAWFKSQRGGSKVSSSKDHPEEKSYGPGNGRDGTRKRDKCKEDGQETPEARKQKGMFKVMETPVFIPYTGLHTQETAPGN